MGYVIVMSHTGRGGAFVFASTRPTLRIPSQSSVVFCVTLPKYVHDMESVSVSTLRSYAGDHEAPRIMYFTYMERTHAHVHKRTGHKWQPGTFAYIINSERKGKGVRAGSSVLDNQYRGRRKPDVPI